MNQNSGKSASLGGDITKLTIAKTITLGITTLSTMLLARFRTLEEYGTYSALLLVISLFISIFILGLPNSINFFLVRAKSKAEEEHFLSVYYTFSTVISIIIGIALVASIPLIEAYFQNPTIRSYLFFLLVYPWASIVISSLDNVLIVYKKTGLLVVFKVVYSTIILITVILIQVFGYGFYEYMWFFLLSNCVFALAVYFIVGRVNNCLKPSLDFRLIRIVLSFSIPIGLSTMVGTISAEFDKLLIGRLMDTAQLAIYTNAAKELPLSIVSASITAVLLPHINRLINEKQIDEAVKLWGIATEISLIFISLIVAGIFTFAEDVLAFLYSDKYLPGLPVFRVYILTLIIRCTYFGMILNAYGQTRKIFYCSIINLVLNAALNPVFYHLFGMVGPALATFVSMLIIAFVLLKMTSVVSSIRYTSIFPWKSIIKILLINIAFAFAFWMLKRIIQLDNTIGSFFESLFLGVIWSFCYLLLMKKTIKSRWESLNMQDY